MKQLVMVDEILEYIDLMIKHPKESKAHLSSLIWVLDWVKYRHKRNKYVGRLALMIKMFFKQTESNTITTRQLQIIKQVAQLMRENPTSEHIKQANRLLADNEMIWQPILHSREECLEQSS